MKEETQRKMSHSSSQFQPRRWMEVSDERQAPVACTTTCSILQEQLHSIRIQEVPFTNIACDNYYPK